MSDSGQGAGDIRIGSAEREAALRQLSFHTNAGRLSPDELAERSAAVEAARTRGELDAVFVDLPDADAQPYGPRPADAAPAAAYPLSVCRDRATRGPPLLPRRTPVASLRRCPGSWR